MTIKRNAISAEQANDEARARSDAMHEARMKGDGERLVQEAERLLERDQTD